MAELQQYKLGQYIDSKNTMNKWCVARVINLVPEHNQLTVRYDGWGNEWDTNFPINSTEIAPFRKHSAPYTGQQKAIIQDWTYSKEEIEGMIIDFHKLVEHELRTEDPYETTQLVRGRMVILVHNLLIHSYKNNSIKKRSAKLFNVIILYICKWLDCYAEIIPCYYEGVRNPEAFLMDDKVALGMSWPELLLTLLRLFGMDLRTSKFFECDFILLKDIPVNSKVNLGSFTSLNAGYFLSVFAQHNGFESILNILCFTEDNLKIPMEMLTNLPGFYIWKHLKREFAEEWTNYFKESIVMRVSFIQNKEIKDIDKEAVLSILGKLKVMPDGNDGIKDLIDDVELRFILKLVKCPYLEKKLTGLRYVIEKTKKNSTIKSEKLKEMILNEKIVEYILESSHVEMTKRILEIMIFLSKHSCITLEHLGLLFNSSKGRHESLVQCIYDIIIKLASHLKVEHINFLMEQFKGIPIGEYDSRLITTVKGFIINAVNSRYSNQDRIDDYCVKILLEIMEDTCDINFQGLATDSLIEILRNAYFRDNLWEIIELCLDRIRNNSSGPQSLRLLKNLLNTLICRSTQRKSIIKKLDTMADDIVLLLIKNTQFYMENLVNVSKFSHLINITERLEFLQDILSAKAISLSIQNFSSLWDIFVVHSVFPTDISAFFEWFEHSYHLIFTNEEIQLIFESFFCQNEKFNTGNITVDQYSCFYQVFLSVNLNRKFINVRRKSIQARLSANLLGLNTLFSIYLDTTNPEIELNIRLLIVDLYTKIGQAILREKQTIWTSFIVSCIDYVNSYTSDESLSRILRLIQFFMNGIPVKEEPSTGQKITIYAQTRINTKYIKVEVYHNTSLGFLRKKLTESYNKPVQSISFGNSVYDSNDDDLPLSTLRGGGSIAIVDFRTVPSDALRPQDFLSTCEELQEFLFGRLYFPENASTELAWDILRSLPTSQSAQQKIQNLSCSLDEILNTSSIYILQYSLLIISELISDKKWLSEFVSLEGPKLLKEIYIKTDCIVNSLVGKYHSLMVSLLETLHPYLESSLSAEFINRLIFSLVVVGRDSKEEDEDKPSTIAQSANRLLNITYKVDPSLFISILTETPYFSELMKIALLGCSNIYFSTCVINLCLDLADKQPILSSFYIEKLLEIVDLAYKIKNRGEDYWTVLSHLIADSESIQLLYPITEKLIIELQSRQPEKTSAKKDVALWGILTVLQKVIPKVKYQISEDFMYSLIHNCLFEAPTQDCTYFIPPPKCKHTQTRRAAFSLVKSLISTDRSSLLFVLNYLTQFHLETKWRTGKHIDWNYHPTSLEKSKTGFVGIKNLGCICYMNSCLQQLFSIRSLRGEILRSKSHSELEESDNLLIQLQKVFSALEKSKEQYINPGQFCQAFKNWEGNPINVFEQMDADEFFNSCMDKLENLLKGTHSEQLIKNYFGGKIVTECIGKDSCPHRSERYEPFMTIPLQVKGKKSIYEGLNEFVEWDLMENDNAYQCDSCENKVTAYRRVCIKYLPNTLVIVLRRFLFNFENMTRQKVNDYCEFPLELNMEPYTQEGLRTIDENTVSTQKYPDEYYQFELKGVIIHTGTADSGHYYSYIKDRVIGNWFEFNDTNVRPFDENLLADEAFGGEERYGNIAISHTEKYQNAYMLFYERKTRYRLIENNDGDIEPLYDTIDDWKIEDFPEILEKNERYWRNQTIYSPEHFEFVLELLSEKSAEILRFSIGFFLTIFIRSKYTKKAGEILKSIEISIAEYPEVAEWVLEVTSVPSIIRELLVYCPNMKKRKFIIALISFTFPVIPSSLGVYLSRLLNLLPEAEISHFTSYYELIYRIRKYNLDLIIMTNLPSLLLGRFFEEDIPYKPYQGAYKYNEIHLTNSEFSGNYPVVKDKHPGYIYIFATVLLEIRYVIPAHLSKLLETLMLYRFSSDCHTKLSSLTIGTLYATICRHDKESLLNYINILISGISNSDSSGRRAYFRQLNCLLSLQENIHETILKKFIDQMKENQRNYDSTETCLNFLFKASAKFQRIRELIPKKQKDLKWIEKWIKESQYHTANSTYTPRTNSGELDLYKKMLKGHLESLNYWDSDTDMPEVSIRPSRILDFNKTGDIWVKAVVCERLGDLIELKTEKSEDKTYWFDINSDALAPDGHRVRRREQ